MEVRTLDGQAATGRLVGLSAEQVVLQTGDERTCFDTEKLLTLASPAKASNSPSATVWVNLVDGSALSASDYVVKDRQASITLADGKTVALATKDIAKVRFQPLRDGAEQEWDRIVDKRHEGDVLVVAKEDALDYHQGILGDISDKSVDFELDGEKIPVKRAKVLGLKYYHPASAPLPGSFCTLTDAGGSRWAVQNIELEGEQLKWTTPAGVQFERPLASATTIDFSGGKIIYLSDLKPDAVRWTPFFGTAEQLPAVRDFYAPRMDQNLAAKPLKTHDKAYNKGIALHSRTELVYRLTDQFSRLKAVAGIDDEVRPYGNVKLVIRGDDRVLFDAVVAGSDDKAQPIDLDISGVRRLSILVDFGEDMDVGDHLDLCLARVSK